MHMVTGGLFFLAVENGWWRILFEDFFLMYFVELSMDLLILVFLSSFSHQLLGLSEEAW